MERADDRRLRVRLDRTVELDAARLRLSDWPGFGGPLVHLPDPLQPREAVLDQLVARLAPRCRVLSLQPRGASPFQVDAADALAMLDQFGFRAPILAGERLGCLPALLLAAWFPSRPSGLVLIEPSCAPSPGDQPGIEALALRDCPPDWAALRATVECPVLVVRTPEQLAEQIEPFVASLASSA